MVLSGEYPIGNLDTLKMLIIVSSVIYSLKKGCMYVLLIDVGDRPAALFLKIVQTYYGPLWTPNAAVTYLMTNDICSVY